MTREDQGVKLSRLGDDAYDSENYSLAEKLYRESLTYLLKNPIVEFKLGRSLREQGNDKEATEYFNKATSQNPNLKEELFQKKAATANQKPEQVFTAEDTLAKDRERQPIDEGTHFEEPSEKSAPPKEPQAPVNPEDALKLGDYYAEREDYAKALQLYSLYAKEHTDDPSVLSRLAAVSSRLGDEASAACYLNYLKQTENEPDKKPKIRKKNSQPAEGSAKSHKPIISDTGSEKRAGVTKKETDPTPKRKAKVKKEKTPWKMRFVRQKKKSDGSGRYDEAENEVNRAVSLINSRLPGGNLTEATHLLHAAGEALIRESVAECCKLACQAQLAANPTTDYLLDNARRNDQNALDAFGKADFHHAVGFWKAALEAYDRAEELALARGQKDDLNTIHILKDKIENNIQKGEVAIENRGMGSSIERGNAATTHGNQLFDSGQYSEAIAQYEQAIKEFTAAKTIAAEQSFANLSEIEASIQSIEQSIQSCHYAHVDQMIQDANAEVESEPERVESRYLAALKYLKDLPYPSNASSDQMILAANEGLIHSRILQAERRIKDGNTFFDGKEYHAAKEHFRSVTEYLNELYDEAVTRKVFSEIPRIQQLVKTCNQAIEDARAGLITISDPEVSLTNPEIIVQGQAQYVPDSGRKQEDYIPPPVDPINPPQELLLDYSSVELIGSGGFGNVYQAKRNRDGKSVAVKVPKILDREMNNIFMKEVVNWKKFDDYENIVTIFDYNASPYPYIEMELCDKSLDDLEKPIPPEIAAKYVFDICSGLKVAHKRKVIHRDLKPQNILLKSDSVRITDWGFSKMFMESRSSSGFKGTINYIAPEQFENKTQDERTDIWQVGVLFYELVVGKNPFFGDGPAIMHHILNKDPAFPSAHRANLTGLDSIIMRCLQKDPNERYRFVEELQKDLATYLNLSYSFKIKDSVSRNNMHEVIRYCGIAMVTNLRSNNLREAYFLSEDLCIQIRGEEKKYVENFRDQLKMRLEEGYESLPEELLLKGEALMHKIATRTVKTEPFLKKPLSFGNPEESDPSSLHSQSNSQASGGDDV